ncbi:PhoH family protein [Endomicrobium proavitum]|uniref:Putative phosphate starvation inducible protein n=1 Tax=Endomicrobium proavitum TaxID=1408281 RepID=A0A0G3WHE7_9BACT|nr:PhoH family protein [Endomicrobium proavitum]AKL97753.1 putative phosphate starvation inducible protein [Endomicrobium proavitum]
MKKTFVLDTNVLLHDPDSIFSFKDNKVVIPMMVIEELDTFKKLNDERGRSARLISRSLDALRNIGKLSKGVSIKDNGILKIEMTPKNVTLPGDFQGHKSDNQILSIAVSLKKKGEKVIFITKDINLRIKAEILNIPTQDYEKSKVKIDELYQGWREMKAPAAVIDQFYKEGKVALPGSFYPNEFVALKDEAGSSKSALTKYSAAKKALAPIFHQNSLPWGLKPLNIEQKFAIELLLCDDINLVTLVGIPGAGKTLLALACGLQKTVEERIFRKLYIARPIIPMGKDIGFLPGTKEEKLGAWMGAINDNLEFLMDKGHTDVKTEEKIDYLFGSGQIEIDSLTYIRGRSLPQQYIIIDDAQNLTPHEVKTIISRAGSGTKIVLTGDPYQIDNPYLDASSNGLTYLVERFKGQSLFGHITFSKSERSNLAALSSELL